jgi:hypothetical protein
MFCANKVTMSQVQLIAARVPVCRWSHYQLDAHEAVAVRLQNKTLLQRSSHIDPLDCVGFM